MENELTAVLQKPEAIPTKSSLMRTIISLGLYIALDYWIFKSWILVFLLVTVIFIHEAGHFLAMKIFGYKSINMTFVPFVGAYVSGEAINFSRKNKIIVLFAGPIPGIIIGIVLFYVYQGNHDPLYLRAAITFLFLNVFNLLPLSPLDGGQIFETLFFSGNKIIQLVFLYISLAVVFYEVYNLKAYSFLFIALLLFVRIGVKNMVSKARRQLDKNNIDYHKSFEDLTADEYWYIRDVVVETNAALSKKFIIGAENEKEPQLIPHVKNILLPVYDDAFTLYTKVIFIIVWLLAFSLPVLLWFHFKEML